MSIARKIILDEIIENSHIENVHDVIFWALEAYTKNSNGSSVAYTIIQRIKDAERDNDNKLVNEELIKSLNL